MEKIIESSNDMSATSTEKSDTFRDVNSASENHDLIDSKKTADGEHLPKEEKISIEKSNDIENNFFPYVRPILPLVTSTLCINAVNCVRN